MSNPTDPQPVHKVHTIPPTEVEEAVQTAKKVERIKKFLVNTGKNVGVPVLIGATAALVVNRQRDREDSDGSESNDDTAPNE